MDAAAYSITGRGRDITLKREVVMGDGMDFVIEEVSLLKKINRPPMWL